MQSYMYRQRSNVNLLDTDSGIAQNIATIMPTLCYIQSPFVYFLLFHYFSDASIIQMINWSFGPNGMHSKFVG